MLSPLRHPCSPNSNNNYYSCLSVVKDSVSLSLSEEFPRLLGDSSQMLRMYMASAVSVLFVRHVAETSAVPAPREHQYKMFEKVAQILVQSLTETVAVSEQTSNSQACPCQSRTIYFVNCLCEQNLTN